MAAVDRRMPNLDEFVGLNWSCWVDTVDIEPPDVPSEDTKSGREKCETMTLGKEDMPIYGHCPAQDDFYLVVCSHCGKVVKPQAFEEHCDRRHGSLTKVCASSSCAPLQQPHRPISQNVSKERQRDSKLREASVPASSTQRKPCKPQKDLACLQAVDKIPQDKTHPAFPLRPRSQPLPTAPLLSNHCRPSAAASVPPSSSPRPSPIKPPVQKPNTTQTTNTPQRDTRTYARTHRNTNIKTPVNKKSEDQDKKKLSTQQSSQTLKMKTDADLPIVASSTQVSELTPIKTKVAESQVPPKENSSSCSKFTPHINVASSHIIRPREASEPTAEEESSMVEVEVQPPYPFNQSLPSSDNSDNEEDCTDVSSTPWHPKPLGLCTFGCHAFGCSVFTFDRRLHHLRIALSAMLEEHVNSHLWKKRPQPASNLRFANASPLTRGSPVHIGARSNTTGSFNIKSTSLEKLKNNQNNSIQTKSPPSASIMTPGPGQQSSTLGQTNRAHMRQRELTQNPKTVQKPPQLSQTTSSKHISPSIALMAGSLSKKTPPLSPLRPTERNTPLLNESPQPNPCPPRSKGRTPGIVQPRAGSCDDRVHVQKRKPQTAVGPASSSPSKKCPRLSPPSRSSLFSWKRDSTQEVWLGVWRKEHTPEDDAPGQY